MFVDQNRSLQHEGGVSQACHSHTNAPPTPHSTAVGLWSEASEPEAGRRLSWPSFLSVQVLGPSAPHCPSPGAGSATPASVP